MVKNADVLENGTSVIEKFPNVIVNVTNDEEVGTNISADGTNSGININAYGTNNDAERKGAIVEISKKKTPVATDDSDKSKEELAIELLKGLSPEQIMAVISAINK